MRIVLCIMLAWATLGSERALANEDHIRRLKKFERSKAADLHDARAVLESKASEDWQPSEVEQYLAEALWVVYYGYAIYMEQNERLPADASTLKGSVMTDWPGNPLDGWKPIEILTPEDGFKPGAMCLQLCPPSAYSRMKDPRPLSFELSVYAQDELAAGLANPQPNNRNTWASIPEGTLFMLGIWTESAESIRRKWEKMKQEENPSDDEGAQK